MKLPAGKPLSVRLHFSDDSRLPVGRMAIDRGVAVLEYDWAFVTSGLTLNPMAPPPGSESLVARDPRACDGLPGAFIDSMPDAWGELLMRRRAERAGFAYASLTALDKLTIVGDRGMGALAYEPADRTPEDPSDIDFDHIAHGSIELLEGRDSDITPLLERLGDSSGGTRPKILIAMNQNGHIIAGDGRIPAGYDAWLVKFRSSRHDALDAGPLEIAYADMARECGVDVPETRLFRGRATAYFGTRRFDRPSSGTRLHVASVAALLEMDWRVPAIDYADLLKIVRRITRDQRAVTQAFRRAVFNAAAHNRDDHARQHAFLMNARGQWSLAPAYDLTLSNGPGGEHYMAIGGRGGDDIRRQDLVRLGTDQGIANDLCEDIVDRTVDTVRSVSTFARPHGVSSQTVREVHRATEAIAEQLSQR